MTDFARANEVLPVARARLFVLPGVHAVGVGRKIVGGDFTNELAIMVFVEHKRPLADLAPAHVIPAEIEGVKTDVYESEIPYYSNGSDPSPDEDRERPLMGGIQIKPGNFDPADGPEDYQGLGEIGTLGCFLTDDGLVPQVWAVTNWHVVGSHPKAAPGAVTNLQFTPSLIAPTGQFTTTPANATVTLGTEVVMEFFLGDNEINAFYTTGPGDTAIIVAQRMADTIVAIAHQLNISDLTATTPTPPDGSFTMHLPAGVRWQLGGPFSPTVGDSKAHPKVDVVQTSVNPPVTTLTFSGTIDTGGGAYLTVNAGGTEATRGIFFATQSDIPAAIIWEINNTLNLSGVTAEAVSDTVVRVKGAQTVKCQFTQDIRVGQPTNRFCTSSCSRCCDRRIGIVTFARLDLELALIQLDPGLQYGGIIKGTSTDDAVRITGTHDVTQDVAAAAGPTTVELACRGRSSPTPTSGHLVAVNVQGTIKYTNGFNIDHAGTWFVMTRYFTNAFAVRAPTANDKFSRAGDSGAAIYTKPVAASDGSKTTTVAGIVFASAKDTSIGTPIQMVLDAVNSWRIPNHVSLVTAASMTDYKTVPGTPGGNPFPTALARVAHRDVTPLGMESARLAQVQREVSATSGGQRYGPLIMKHLDEAQTLVNTNRKMATVWHRNGGPAIADALLRMVEIPGQRIPAVINGTPLEDCLQQIANALARYGSDALRTDIKAYGPALVRLAHLTYPELLSALG